MAQKTVLQIAQQLAPTINLPRPQLLVTSTDGTYIKLFEQINAVCDDLLKEYDWELLQTRYPFQTVANQAAYSFPTDIDRWIAGTFWDSSRRWQLVGPLTPSQYEQALATNLTVSPFQRYRVFAGTITFYPTPGAIYNFVYEYISNNYVIDGSTQLPKNSVTQDSDIIRFDHRLVIYGTKLKWLESLGHDTTAALTEFNRALEYQKGADKPSALLDGRGFQAGPFITNQNYPDGSWST